MHAACDSDGGTTLNNLLKDTPISFSFLLISLMNIDNMTQMLHVWTMYLHVPQKWLGFVGTYSSTIQRRAYKMDTLW